MNHVAAKKSAFYFVIVVGIVSLFADMTYEGARSINGPFLALLGANAFVVGAVAGSGELIGYALRMVSGRWADRSRKYWLITIAGYVCNMLAVPLLAFVGQWPLAALLMIIERAGKGLRVPPRDAMLSHACERLGSGFGFGLHEALDQTGAVLGPLLAALAFHLSGQYHDSYLFLLFPALCALLMLGVARHQFPRPEQLSIKQTALPSRISSRAFIYYLIASSLVAAGFADFPLMAYHFEKMQLLPSAMIPVTYAGAMGASGVTGLLLGPLYDRQGLIVLLIVTLIAAFFAPLVFLTHGSWIVLGVALWSIGVGAQGSLMRAVIANQVPADKRATAYGTFNLVYGVAWFAGSLVIGALYNVSFIAVVSFSLVTQLLGVAFLYVVVKCS